MTILSIAPETRRIALALARAGADDETVASATAAASGGAGGFGAMGDFLTRAKRKEQPTS